VTGDSIFVRTANSVLNNDWPRQFKDLTSKAHTDFASGVTSYSGGDDVLRWSKRFSADFVHPLIASGPDKPGPMRAIDAVDLIVPCFFDTQPVQSKQYAPGVKVKFNGDYARGFLLLTGGDIVSIWEVAGSDAFEIHRDALSSVSEWHELEFKMSKLSMTSAEKGYEVLFHDHRMLFRVAVMAQSSYFYDVLTNRLDGTFIPLFKGMRCVDWVAHGSSHDPHDEMGELRHYPYD